MAAIKAVLAGSADSINTAALNHGIPQTTLKNGSLEELLMELIQDLLPNMEEKELEEYLLQANKMGYMEKQGARSK